MKSMPFIVVIVLIAIVVAIISLLTWQRLSDETIKPQLVEVTDDAVQDDIASETTDVLMDIQEVEDAAAIEIIPNTDDLTFSVLVDGVKRATISTDTLSQAELMKVSSQYAFIGLNPEGLGGYILYDGSSTLYRLNLANYQIVEIDVNGEAMSVSSDDSTVAIIRRQKQSLGKSVVLKDLNSGFERVFNVSEEFSTAGDVMFSPDGKNIVYAAAAGNPDDEKGAVIMVEVFSGKQTVLEQRDGGYFTVSGWADNDTPVYKFQ